MTYDREYIKYIHSSDWKKKALERLELDGHTCCVCGKPATEVHHLTYDHFRDERMDELASLCHECHMKAEGLYEDGCAKLSDKYDKTKENNFIAYMRQDAETVSEDVCSYIFAKCGADFDSLMKLREPDDEDHKKYWNRLKTIVVVLCSKRYLLNSVNDRRDMMLTAILNRCRAICLSSIEHSIRNKVQRDLHEIVTTDYLLFEKWKPVSEELAITTGTLNKLKTDDGSTLGPTLRQAVMYYLALDAASGIKPIEGFSCLNDGDYSFLNEIATYMKEELSHART